MKKKEKTAYRFLRKCISAGDRLDRVENIVVSGMPDQNGCFDGHEFWIESKSPREPKRKSTPLFGSNHKLSSQQRNWILSQRIAGGNVFIFIHCETFSALIDGKFCDDINTMTKASILSKALWTSKAPCKPVHESLRASIIEACSKNGVKP